MANDVLKRGDPNAPGRADDLRTRCLCFMHCSMYQEALDEMRKCKLDMPFETAYCLYSLSKYDETLAALKSMKGGKTAGMLHLEAQVHYRRGDYRLATSCFDALNEMPSQEGSDFVANVLASYASSGQTERGLKLSEELSPDSWEGVYNQACIQIDAGQYDQARTSLAAALKKGRETLEMEDLPEEEIEDELAVVHAQTAYLEQLCGNDDEAMAGYTKVHEMKPEDLCVDATARNNIVSLKGERDLFLGLKHLKIASNPALERRFSTRQRVTVERNVLGWETV